MKKFVIPALLTVCALISIFSPWSGSAVAGIGSKGLSDTASTVADYRRQPGFAFDRGGYRHAMPTWRQ